MDIEPASRPRIMRGMRGFLIELAKVGGAIALEHFRKADRNSTSFHRKGQGDYVTHADRAVEDALRTRILRHFADHVVLGEESHDPWPTELTRPCWIIDPIDGTTNFMRGLPGWAISICYCDQGSTPRHAMVYDPVHNEMFIAERGAGLWLGDRRVYTSPNTSLEQSVISMPLPFRSRDSLQDLAEVITRIQRRIDDSRRMGSAAIDLAYVAVGRLDAYFELGIYPWDTAAGELLVACGGGVASDLRGGRDGLLGRRSILAAGTAELHAALLKELKPVAHWLDDPRFAPHGTTVAPRQDPPQI